MTEKPSRRWRGAVQQLAVLMLFEKVNFLATTPQTQTQTQTYLSGLEKSAAIRPFATKKSRLASEKILLADSLATKSCPLADRWRPNFLSKRTTPIRTERDRARSLADVFVGPRCKGVGRSGPSIVFASKPTPSVEVPSLRFSF